MESLLFVETLVETLSNYMLNISNSAITDPTTAESYICIPNGTRPRLKRPPLFVPAHKLASECHIAMQDCLWERGGKCKWY